MDFSGLTKVRSLHAASAEELKPDAEDMHILTSFATPHVSETNGTAERAIRHVEEGVGTILVRAGFSPTLWPVAAEYCGAACNFTQEWLGETPYQRRCKDSFQGLSIPCGALVELRPPKPD